MTKVQPAASCARRPLRRPALLAVVSMSVVAILTISLGTVAAPLAGTQDQPAEEKVGLAIESRVEDVSSDELTLAAMATLSDPRGWGQADFTFESDPESANRVVLAEPDVADELCAPIETGGRSSCQNGPVVVLNANSWREVPEGWPDLDTYRQYMINHGVGHLLGQFHPSNRCPVPGEPEALMAPQTDGLEGCTANPWPLDWEASLAAKRPAELAPTPDVKPDVPSVNPGGGVVAAAAPEAPTTTAADTTAPSTTDPQTTEPEADATQTETGASETDAKRARSGQDSSSGAPLVALGIVAVLVLVGVVIALAWLRRRSKRTGVFDEYQPAGVLGGDEAATVLAETETVPFGGADPCVGTPLTTAGDEIDVVAFPAGVRHGEGGSDAEVPPVERWNVRLSGRAQRDGFLLWLTPQRWEPGEVDAFRRAISDGVLGEGEAVSQQGAPADDQAQRVGAALGGFLRQRPHLAPAEHEGLGLVVLGDDHVVAAVLGAAELVELRSGLAKPVRRRGVLRLRDSAASPLEVELSVTPPARPRARIVVERSDGVSSPT